MSRAWFVYNPPGLPDTKDATNYAYVTLIPSCSAGRNICAVLGIYEPETYGNHPRPFSVDSNLETYIDNAIATGTDQPAPAGNYVLVKA